VRCATACRSREKDEIRLRKNFYPRPSRPPSYSPSVPSAGTPIMTVIAWEGAGASGGGLTWPAARGGRVQGFPWGHYGPCALDERLSFGRMAAQMPPSRAKSEAERARTEIAGGRGRPRQSLLSVGTASHARFPTSLLGARGAFFDNGQGGFPQRGDEEARPIPPLEGRDHTLRIRPPSTRRFCPVM
jgi:hypothetical protein